MKYKVSKVLYIVNSVYCHNAPVCYSGHVKSVINIVSTLWWRSYNWAVGNKEI
jgi:hypothetical protein